MSEHNKDKIEMTLEDLTNCKEMPGWRAVVFEVEEDGTRSIRDIFVMERKEDLMAFLEREGFLKYLKRP